MRNPHLIVVPIVFFIAAVCSLLAAKFSVTAIEQSSRNAVEDALVLKGHEWTSVEVDGLKLILSGTAPNEAARFRAMSVAGSTIDAARVIDNMRMPPEKEIKPPRFVVEILRNDTNISMIGLIPAETDRSVLNENIKDIAGNTDVTDLLEVASYPKPQNWDEALEYSVFALETLPRSKISMDAGKVSITALADSMEQKAKWAHDLKRAAPRSILLSIDISAPRPVITPFTLRFIIDDEGARFDACSAHDSVGRAQIFSAATEAGMTETSKCTIGLGVPSPEWSEAVTLGIKAVQELQGGSITFSDADATLVAPENTPMPLLDKVVGQLESNLPELYSLHLVLPKSPNTGDAIQGTNMPEFIATRSPEGQVQLRGRLTDEVLRSAAVSFARAKFGSAVVTPATRLDTELPENWPTRVLAGLEALSYLSNGTVVVQPNFVEVSGATGDLEASDTISRILGEKLGASENFQVNVSYKEALDPNLLVASPQQCAKDINAIMEVTKITFATGSAIIEASAAGAIDKIAEVMKECADVRMEIAGYTDSQGPEEMNQALSKNRARAVLTALLMRRVLTTNLTATGYGEADPIADNTTEEGREANRRIEFRLLELALEDEADLLDDVDTSITGDAGSTPTSDTTDESSEAPTSDTTDSNEPQTGDGTGNVTGEPETPNPVATESDGITTESSATTGDETDEPPAANDLQHDADTDLPSANDIATDIHP